MPSTTPKSGGSTASPALAAPNTPSGSSSTNAGQALPPPPASPRGRASPSPRDSSSSTTSSSASAPAPPAPSSTASAFSRLFSRPTFEFSRPSFDFGGGSKTKAPASTTTPSTTATAAEEKQQGSSRRGSSSLSLGLSFGGGGGGDHDTSRHHGGKKAGSPAEHQQQQGANGQPVAAAAGGPPLTPKGSGVAVNGVIVRVSEDSLGISAKVQWSSPIRKKGGELPWSTGGLQRLESGQIDEDNEDGPEETDDGVFTHGECLSFHLTFGPGPIGLVVADTKANKGVFVEDFIKIQTKGGPVATAAELSGRIQIGDVITHVGQTDVQFSSASLVRDLLEKSARPVTLSFERFPQRYSFKELSQDPRKMPFFFEHLLADLPDMDESRLEQAKVMFWMETGQFKAQYRNLSSASRPVEAKRLFDKFLRHNVSQFDVTGVLGEEIVARLTEDYYGGGISPPTDDSRLSAGMFEEAKALVEEDITASSFQRFRRSRSYLRMVGFLSRSPEFVPLEVSEVLGDPDMLQFFMLFLMANRRHAALRCYLDMDRLVKPRVAALEQLIKEGRAETDKAKEVVVWVLQGALRVHSLYLSNGSYMELPLKPLTHLQNWLRAVLAARPDIARIQRRASKLSSKNPGKVLETEVVGNQLLRLAHSPDPTSKALFALPIAEAMAVANEVLEAQRSILRELSCDVFPRFQAHAMYEALCEEIGPDWRTLRAKSRGLSLKPGSIKRLLRKAKLPREFAVHRTALPSSSPTRALPASKTTEGSVGVGEDVDSSADWLVVFDTEFSQQGLGLKVRTTSQIPVSAYAAEMSGVDRRSAVHSLPRGVENFLVPDEFPTKVSFVEPEPQLFNFLIPGRDERPFYGACLLMYRPATEAMLDNDDDDDDDEDDDDNKSAGGGASDGEAGGSEEGGASELSPGGPILHVDLTLSGTLTPLSPSPAQPGSSSGSHGGGGLQLVPASDAAPPLPFGSSSSSSAAGEANTPIPAHLHRSSDASVRTRSTTQSSLPDQQQQQQDSSSSPSLTADVMRARKMSFKIERGDEDEHRVKAMASLLLYSSPKHDEATRKPPLAREGGGEAGQAAPVVLEEDDQGLRPIAPPEEEEHDDDDDDGMRLSLVGTRRSTMDGSQTTSTSSSTHPHDDDEEDAATARRQGEDHHDQEAAQRLEQSPEGGGHDRPTTQQDGSGGKGGLVEVGRGSSLSQLDQELGAMPVLEEGDEEEEEEEDGGAKTQQVEGGEATRRGDGGGGSPASVDDVLEDETESILALVAADFQDSKMHAPAPTAHDIAALISSSASSSSSSSTGEASSYLLRDGPDGGDRLLASTSAGGGSSSGISPGGVSGSGTSSSSSVTLSSSSKASTAVSPNRRAAFLEPDARLRRGSTSMSSSGGIVLSARSAAPATPLTFAPYGFCLISRLPFINSLRAPLAALFDQRSSSSKSTPLRIIQEALAKQAPVRAPLTALDRFDLLAELAQRRHQHQHHQEQQQQQQQSSSVVSRELDFELEALFRCLSPRNLVTVFLALLLELKVVLVSERLTLLTVVAEALRLLVQPLKWCHVYVPLLPEVMVDHLVGCPTPYLMGLHRKTLLAKGDDGFPLHDVVKVDLDCDLVEAPAKDLTLASVPFAAPLARKFERCASPYTALSDSFRWPHQLLSSSSGQRCLEPDVEGALQVLRDFIESLLVSMEDCCYRICTESEMTILFDETLFGHINGPPELLGPCLADMESDMLEHAPLLAAGRRATTTAGGAEASPQAPASNSSCESFVLRFSRTQAFSQHLMRTLQAQPLIVATAVHPPPPPPSSSS